MSRNWLVTSAARELFKALKSFRDENESVTGRYGTYDILDKVEFVDKEGTTEYCYRSLIVVDRDNKGFVPSTILLSSDRTFHRVGEKAGPLEDETLDAPPEGGVILISTPLMFVLPTMRSKFKVYDVLSHMPNCRQARKMIGLGLCRKTNRGYRFEEEKLPDTIHIYPKPSVSSKKQVVFGTLLMLRILSRLTTPLREIASM